jgi:pimeloyl-ACP methyl ester carboxylesterase
MQDAYSMLWKMIIRPPRDIYALEELGPAKFRLGKRVYERRDLQLRNPNGFMLECSHFVPSKSPDAQRPCVIYLHGNCSSRLEAFDALPVLLPRDFTVFCLDLSGSGRSEGEYISLGFNEEKDLTVVIEHLRSSPSVTAIGLWGRSMGAVTAVNRASKDHEIAACVIDSAFGNLKEQAYEIVNRGRFKLPTWLINMAFDLIRDDIFKRAGFHVEDIDVVGRAPYAICPALFGCASDDSFIQPHHTQDIHNAWGGERMLRVYDGGHNGIRPAWFLEEASDFMTRHCHAAALKAKHLKKVKDLNAIEEEEEEADEPGLIPVVGSEEPNVEVKRRPGLSAELQHMGFSEEAASRAAEKNKTVDGAVEWLLKDRNEAFTQANWAPAGNRSLEDAIGNIDGASAASTLLRVTTSENIDTQDTSPLNRDLLARVIKENPLEDKRGDVKRPTKTKAKTVAMRSSGGGNLELPGATLIEQLLYLGFDQSQCEAAAKHCQSIEVAVEWLSSQRATVQL